MQAITARIQTAPADFKRSSVPAGPDFLPFRDLISDHRDSGFIRQRKHDPEDQALVQRLENFIFEL